MSGKKTYIVGICALIGAFGSAYGGSISWAEFAAIAVPAVLGMTLRSAITTEAAK